MDDSEDRRDANDENDEDDGEQIITSEELLSQLMTALAAGARAVQGLPFGDEFAYQSSYPEFRHLCDETHESLLDALVLCLTDATDYDFESFQSLDDPLLWEACADVCDVLLEQAEQELNSTSASSDQLRSTKNQAQKSFGRLLQGIVMERQSVSGGTWLLGSGNGILKI